MCIFFKTTTIYTDKNRHKELEYDEIINNTHKIKQSGKLLSKE